MIRVLATKVFSAFDQDRFALLSGDRNPMHVDPIAARRTQAGATVVHGMHAVLWALDNVLRSEPVPDSIASLAVRFHKFIHVGTTVELQLSRAKARSWRLELYSQGVVALTIDVTFGPRERAESPNFALPRVVIDLPIEHDLADMEGLAGVVPAPVHRDIAANFSVAAAVVGRQQVAALANLSSLVGMVVPGLHSIFSSFEIDMVDCDPCSADLSFAVSTVDDRIRMVQLTVEGGGIRGTVMAFLRQPPIQQLLLRDLMPLVHPGEFAHSHALIIGGSRGLGALTAGIIVAGGGSVSITYNNGFEDAHSVARDLGIEHERVIRYDARESAKSQLECLAGDDVSELYYFATNQISQIRSTWYSPASFNDFAKIYVDGFADVCGSLSARQDKLFAAFYPSSVAVVDRPRDFTEYSMAKAAGEVLCADMNRFARGFKVLVKRLPRVLTDQTATVMPIASAEPAAVMLPIVREMSRLIETGC